MQKALSILVVSQIICISSAFSQKQTATTVEKPSTDACPSWNKKQPASKASYFAYLSKRKATAEPRDFNTPRYRNTSPVPVAPTGSPSVKPRTLTGAAIKDAEPELTRQIPAPDKKEIAATTVAPVVKKPEQTKPIAVKEEAALPEEKGKMDTTVKKEKKAEKKKAGNKTHPIRTWFKKLHFGKKNATSCPDF
ncbi:MAG TPA: hypothetical protein VGC65_09585 [Bacteroidia bacterium]|jgi:hypothetical protein